MKGLGFKVFGHTVLMFLFLSTFSSCIYKMPEEDMVDLRPTTNNPTVIPVADNGLVPGLKY